MNQRCFSLAAVLFLGACGGSEQVVRPADPVIPGPATPQAPVATLVMSSAAVSVTINTNLTMAAFAFDSVGAQLLNRPVTWESADPSVASITSIGVMHGNALGTTTIKATCEGKVAFSTVTVTPVAPGPVNAIFVSPVSSMLPGQTRTITVTMVDARGAVLTDRSVTFASSNTAIATVNAATGVVTGIAPGTALVSATSEGKTSYAGVTVLAPVSYVQVEPPVSALTPGRTQKVVVTLLDDALTKVSGRVVLWSSSNPGVAIVDADGLITAVAPGKTTVTATSEGKSAAVAVTVNP